MSRPCQHRPSKSGVKRQRSQSWATALFVCIATLQSMQTIEYGESFVFVTPPSTPSTTTTIPKDNLMFQSKRRASSIPYATTSLGARRKEDPPPASSRSPKKKQRKRKSKSTQFTSTLDASYKLLNHEILTKDQEYELGLKIRKFIDTKKVIQEMIKRKKEEEEKRKLEDKRRREQLAEDRRKLTELIGEEYLYEDEDDNLSMEEELEEYLESRGLSTNIGRRANSGSIIRNSIEEIYGSFADEDDEEAMMEELGMAVYGIDNYSDDKIYSDDLAIVDSYGNGDGLDAFDDDNYSVLPETPASSQLGDTLDDIRFLTEEEIKDELGIEGGRGELVQIMILGALAKQKMIKSNVRLVTSIARKWMKISKDSTKNERNSETKKANPKFLLTGDWTTPSMDEVIQQGIVGLAIAAERFEPERKFKFSTYATYYITNEVRNTFQSATTQCLYVPPYFYTIKNKYEKIVRDHFRMTAGDPDQVLSLEDIAKMLDMKASRLHFILRSTRPLVQLDAPPNQGLRAGKAGGIEPESQETIVDNIATEELTPEQVVELSLLRQCIENALAAELLPLERDIVRLRHGLDDGKSRTVKEVVETCGGMLTVAEIRKFESQAYKKLRFKHSVHNARLRDFAQEYIGVSPEMLEKVV